MSRPTSLDKFLTALDATDTGWLLSRSDDGRGSSWDPHKTTVSVLDVAGVERVWSAFVNDPNSRWHPDTVTVGYEAHFDAGGKLLGANPLKLEGWSAFVSNEKQAEFGEDYEAQRLWAKANATFAILENRGSYKRNRARYDIKTFTSLLSDVLNHSPAAKAALAELQARKAAERVAEQAAKVERIRALKPDVRNTRYAVANEADRAANDVKGSLKSLINRATEALDRFDENGYVYDSDFTHLLRIASDALAAAHTVKALKVVTDSELAPLFEGSPWTE